MSLGSGVWLMLCGVTSGPEVMSTAAGDLECQCLLLELIGVGEMHSELILAGKAFAIFRSWLGLGRAVSPRTLGVKMSERKDMLNMRRVSKIL